MNHIRALPLRSFKYPRLLRWWLWSICHTEVISVHVFLLRSSTMIKFCLRAQVFIGAASCIVNMLSVRQIAGKSHILSISAREGPRVCALCHFFVESQCRHPAPPKITPAHNLIAAFQGRAWLRDCQNTGWLNSPSHLKPYTFWRISSLSWHFSNKANVSRCLV